MPPPPTAPKKVLSLSAATPSALSLFAKRIAGIGSQQQPRKTPFMRSTCHEISTPTTPPTKQQQH
eukprot:2707790-Alexandrium_andersonii.AAC.1